MANDNITFPMRPIKVRMPRGIFFQFFALLWPALFLCCVAAGIITLISFLTATAIPELVSDFNLRDTARPLAGAIIEQSNCADRDDYLMGCRTTLLLRRQGLPELRREVNYLYVNFHSGKYTLKVVADPSQPEKMTTNFALYKLWNRTVTLLLFSLVLLLLGLFAAWWITTRSIGPLLAQWAVVRALSNQVLRQTLLRLDDRSYDSWYVSTLTPTGAGKSCRWLTSETPIIMNPSQNLVLGVTTGDGSKCMPLGIQLSWIDLTDAERTQMLEQVGLERLNRRDMSSDDMGD